MGNPRDDSDSSPAQAAPARLCWRSCPLADDFPRSLVFVVVFVGTCVLFGVAFGGWGYGLLAAAMLAFSLGRYYLPTRFELDEHGLTVRFLGQAGKLPWNQVRRASVQAKGVYLSPLERSGRLDSFRNTFLRFSGNADEVVSFVERFLDVNVIAQHARGAGGATRS